jgi:hypothetical protein
MMGRSRLWAGPWPDIFQAMQHRTIRLGDNPAAVRSLHEDLFATRHGQQVRG